jgi:hypothetical protein
MEKLVREDRPVTVNGKTDIRSPIGMSEAGWHDAEKIKELFEALLWKRELEEKDQYVYKNQRTRHDRHGAARNRVLNWKHLGT